MCRNCLADGDRCLASVAEWGIAGCSDRITGRSSTGVDDLDRRTGNRGSCRGSIPAFLRWKIGDCERKTSRRQKRSSWLSSAEEGDSPQCGEMSRRDKRAGHLLKWRASCSPKSNVSHETIRENKLFFHVGCNYRAAGK